MSDHIVRSYSEELEQLSANLMRMGGLAEEMIADTCRAVATEDMALAQDVVARDQQVDALETEVERAIMRIIALRQPMANDLRVVLSAMKISHDLERIGDLARNISGRAIAMRGFDSRGTLKGVERMGTAVAGQLHAVLNAYASRDDKAAVQVWANDEEIDQHYNSLFRDMVEQMTSEPALINAGAHLLFVAKNLERIGDHCTNIAEEVFFLVTGQYLSSDARPKAPQLVG